MGQEHFALIGEAILAWNRTDHAISEFMCQAMQVPWLYWHDVVVRMDGSEQKVDLIRARLRNDLGESHEAFVAIDNILGRYKGLKRYRDHLAHLALYFEIKAGITVQRRKVKTFYPTLGQLETIATHMRTLIKDVEAAQRVFNLLYGNRGTHELVQLHYSNDPKTPQTQQSLQQYLQTARPLQSPKALTPLPELPK